jgi:hypothetical protein
MVVSNHRARRMCLVASSLNPNQEDFRVFCEADGYFPHDSVDLCYGLVEARSLLSRRALGAGRTRAAGRKVNTPSASIHQAEHIIKED